MKATGIVRRMDDLGRIVIPKEVRKTLNIKEGDPLEIFVTEDSVVIKKYTPGCVFCNNVSGTLKYNGSTICDECLDNLKDL